MFIHNLYLHIAFRQNLTGKNNSNVLKQNLAVVNQRQLSVQEIL